MRVEGVLVTYLDVESKKKFFFFLREEYEML